jgi:hypothetical protein
MPDESPVGTDDLQASLLRRVEALERENDRLRQQLEPLVGTLPEYNPNFHPGEFMKALRRTLLAVMLPLQLLAPVVVLLAAFSPRVIPPMQVGPLPLVDFAGVGTRHPGLGMGIVAVGGIAFGVVSVGGLGTGVIAFGGGSIGLVAIGGGSVGVIALGGGAVGFIAVGGGACGYYALAQRATGKYALALNRQDPEAVEFFRRWIPSISRAVTNPMPVLPV